MKDIIQCTACGNTDTIQFTSEAGVCMECGTPENYRYVDIHEFVQIAKQTNSTQEFIDRARQIKDVPQYVSDWFENEYGANGMLSIDKASEHFINDVKDGYYG